MTYSIIFCIKCESELVDVVGWLDGETADLKCRNCKHETTVRGFTLGRCNSQAATEALKEARKTRAVSNRPYSSQKGPFEQLVLLALDVAKQYRKEHDAQRIARDAGVDLRTPSEDELLGVLDTLSDERLWKLTALMDSGRPPEDDVITVYRQLEKKPYNRFRLAEKLLRADEFLEKGLVMAKRAGIDLEADFETLSRR